MNEITASALSTISGATIVDVRESEEFRAGHVPGAIPIPLSVLEARTAELPLAGPVYVICQTGGRSARAAEYLTAHGVNAVNVIGGTFAWQQAGLPIEPKDTP